MLRPMPARRLGVMAVMPARPSPLPLPAAAVVFWLDSWMVGLAYFVLNLLTFQERFILGLHYGSHRRLFKNRWLNQWDKCHIRISCNGNSPEQFWS